MATRQIIIFAEPDGGWRVGFAARGGGSAQVIDVPADDESSASRLAEALRATGVAPGTSVILALPTDTCLCASISITDLPTKERAQAMVYRLEEKLPLAAEEVVAGFISNSGTALSVAVDLRVLRSLMDTVESAGVKVRSVCPASLLALQSRITDTSDPHAILWPTAAGRAELFVVARGVPVAWYALTDDPDDIALHMKMAALHTQGMVRVETSGLPVPEIGLPIVENAAVSLAELAMAADSRGRPWIDLANRASANGASRTNSVGWFAAAAVTLCMGSLAIALHVLATRYERLAERREAAQESVFRTVYPDQVVPFDVRSRLLSESRKTALEGSTPSANGLIVLRDLMTFLPTDNRFRVSEVRLDDGKFTIEGEARTHGDAEAVAQALRRRSGFSVESPRTEQREGRGVAFTLNGGLVPTAEAQVLEQRASK